MNALLTAVALWLSANFDLPIILEHPRVEFVPAATITGLRYKGLSGGQPINPAYFGVAGQHRVVAVYDGATSTIYLPDGWTGGTPAELSVLVHEMVHHLQNVAQIVYDCPPQRETLAYEAQDKWLGLFGRSLLSDFEIDPLTLFLITRCHGEIAD